MGDPSAFPFVSTGTLPLRERVQDLVSAAYETYRSNTEGANSDVYPALAGTRSDLFGICVARTSGETFVAGDAETEFTIMSVAKPFVLALVCEALSPRPRRTSGTASSCGCSSAAGGSRATHSSRSICTRGSAASR